MPAYDGGCMGRGTEGAYCICICHHDPSAACDDLHCAPVSAKASDNVRMKHVNRDPDSGKFTSKRGRRSLRKA